MHVTTLADPAKLIQLTTLFGTPRPFQHHKSIRINQKSWISASIDDYTFLISEKIWNKGAFFGRLAERLYWALCTKVRNASSPEIVVSYYELRQHLWGNTPPKNWKAIVRKILLSFFYLRLSVTPNDIVTDDVKLTLLIRSLNKSRCGNELTINTGGGLLGSLEACFINSNGVDRFDFQNKQILRQLRRQRKIIDVYLPCYLGRRSQCERLTSQQKLLLQIILREVTTHRREKADVDKTLSVTAIGNMELITDSTVRGFSGPTMINCPAMIPGTSYAGFNGNGSNQRRGRGYLLQTWQMRANYCKGQTDRFLQDLARLSEELKLLIGAVDRSNKWHNLERLIGLNSFRKGQSDLGQMHLRIYAPENFLEIWNRYFNWDQTDQIHGSTLRPKNSTEDVLDELQIYMQREKWRQKDVAEKLDVSPQYVSKMLRTRKCSEDQSQKIAGILAQSPPDNHRHSTSKLATPGFRWLLSHTCNLQRTAEELFDEGMCVIPMKPGTKMPYIRWKQYQSDRPSRDQVMRWWQTWPDAGIAVVLGPISNLICVDIDGKSAHQILIDHLSEVPRAPTVKSGSRDPFRYHLYFEWPKNIACGATVSPWNDSRDSGKLEIRGHGGLSVLPPSVHKSGRHYRWVLGRTFRNIAPPPLPQAFKDALLASQTSKCNGKNEASEFVPFRLGVQDVVIAKSTGEFLRGQFADADGSWNQLLFKAACDLCARKVDLNLATEHLLTGARPRTDENRRQAMETIRSAYSNTRKPSAI